MNKMKALKLEPLLNAPQPVLNSSTLNLNNTIKKVLLNSSMEQNCDKKVESLEEAIRFIQCYNSQILSCLHDEVDSLKKKNQELQMEIIGLSMNRDSEEMVYNKINATLDKAVQVCLLNNDSNNSNSSTINIPTSLSALPPPRSYPIHLKKFTTLSRKKLIEDNKPLYEPEPSPVHNPNLLLPVNSCPKIAKLPMVNRADAFCRQLSSIKGFKIQPREVEDQKLKRVFLPPLVPKLKSNQEKNSEQEKERLEKEDKSLD